MLFMKRTALYNDNRPNPAHTRIHKFFNVKAGDKCSLAYFKALNINKFRVFVLNICIQYRQNAFRHAQ